MTVPVTLHSAVGLGVDTAVTITRRSPVNIGVTVVSLPPTERELTHNQLDAEECSYLMYSKIENIGMYSATIMPPMTTPMNAIISGSIRAVSCSAVDCTSWS